MTILVMRWRLWLWCIGATAGVVRRGPSGAAVSAPGSSQGCEGLNYRSLCTPCPHYSWVV